MQSVKNNGIPKIAEKKKNFPFVVVSPQYELDMYYFNLKIKSGHRFLLLLNFTDSYQIFFAV